MSRGTRRGLAAGAGLSLGAFGLTPTAQAVDYTVLNKADAGANSLRALIATANSTAANDRILFSANVTGTITLTSGEIPITDALEVVGPGAKALTISGDNASQIFGINPTAAGDVVKISGLTLTAGRASYGGAIYANDTVLTISDSVLSGNGAHSGAALFVDGSFGQQTTIRSSTISGNHTFQPMVGARFGGGIQMRHYGPVIANSTISDNSADFGGGVSTGGRAVVVNSTISGNTATVKAGGWYGSTTEVDKLYNTILAANSSGGPGTDDAYGSLDAATTIIGDSSGTTISSGQGLKVGVDPRLGPLRDNGGSTPTMLPTPGSPAIDQGANSPSLVTDQRGQPRPFDVPSIPNFAATNGTDIGAVELTLAEATPSAGPPAAAASPPLVTAPRKCKKHRKLRKGKCVRKKKKH